jgi:ADP-ribose pyrophosphatase
MATLHSKARGIGPDGKPLAYPSSEVQKAAVPDASVSWDIDFPAYAPVDYLAPSVAKGPVWADKPDASGCKFGEVDGNVDRTSFEAGGYRIDPKTQRPLNPRGRTGMTNRGLLGRWGPNHAADPIVTRWAEGGAPGGKRVLEFVAIRRNDGGGWAIPGGMVEPGDTVSATLKKEFGEEALNSMTKDKNATAAMEAAVDELFKDGRVVYKGYVDDPRNTDNAWMETCAYHFHAEDRAGEPNPLHKLTLAAGDDAGAVAWTAITADLKLYASHKDYVMAVAKEMKADL